MDVWKAGGPQIDMLSPDAYSDRDFAAFCAKFDQPGNPLFVPENMGGADGAARVLYIFGRHDAIGWTVMGITDPKLPHPDLDMIGSTELIRQLAPLISEHQGNGTMSAVLLRTANDPPQKVQVGELHAGSLVLQPAKNVRGAAAEGPSAPGGGAFHCDGA